MFDIPESLYTSVKSLIVEKSTPVIAIDGRCGAGKSTLAALLCDRFGGSAVHADDFFSLPK